MKQTLEKLWNEYLLDECAAIDTYEERNLKKQNRHRPRSAPILSSEISPYVKLQKTPDFAVEHHHNEVNDPDEPSAENTDNTCEKLTFLESGNNAADPRGEGNYREDNANESGKTKVIALFCHWCKSPFQF